MSNLKIYNFYSFIELSNKQSLKHEIEEVIGKFTIRGTILLADEGINGSISGKESDLNDIVKFIKKKLSIRKLDIKVNEVDFLPFKKIKIRLKKEIVSLGKGKLKKNKRSVNYIDPSEWDNFIKQKDIALVDIRNNYEINIGNFKKFINPGTNTFREFPYKFNTLNLKKDKKIAIYCTGGIRCEKASKYLNMLGYKEIFQLKGGIINYLNLNKNKKQSSWSGECFVFDDRVAINRSLKRGKYLQCHGCRYPISSKDITSKFYIKGISCPNCFETRTLQQKQKSEIRQKQIDAAEQKKLKHPFKKIMKL